MSYRWSEIGMEYDVAIIGNGENITVYSDLEQDQVFFFI